MSETDVQEVILLRASTTADEFQWRGTPEEIQQWDEGVMRYEQDESLCPSFIECPMAYALRLGTDSLSLHVQCSSNHDRSPTLTLHGPMMEKERLQSIKEQLVQLEERAKRESISNFVFDIFTGLQSSLEHDAEPLPSSDTMEEQRDWQQKESSKEEEQRSFEMLRVIFWTHHLKAPSKKRDMNKWCSELRVFGLVKSGYPGFLCFEGERESVQEIVRRIKSLQWHAITVKTEVPYTMLVEGENKDALTTILTRCCLARQHSSMNIQRTTTTTKEERKLRPAMDEVFESAALVQRLRDARLPEEEIMYALNLRS